jgi:hypothetical protein
MNMVMNIREAEATGHPVYLDACGLNLMLAGRASRVPPCTVDDLPIGL